MSVLDVQNKQIDIELTGGLLTDIPTADVPPGLSPANQDCDYLPRAAGTRYGIGPGIFPAITGNPTINYLKTFEQQNLIESLLALDSSGNLWQSLSQAGGLSPVGTVLPGTFGKSCTAFGREYIGFSDGKFGLDIPRQFDGQYFDRVSQVGPGAPPSVADSASAGSITIGVHQLVVMFVTRSAYITKPSPPVSWTAAGSKKAAVTNIPIGPPNVVARILAFTAAAGATWFYLPSMVINDNTTTSLTIDFTDTALLAGSPVALLFNNQELGEVSGFLSYANRLITWGERNKLFNLLNLTFDGGFSTTPAGNSIGPNSPSAASDVAFGTGPAWSNPNNIFALDGAFATWVVPSTVGISDKLQGTGYGFAIPAGVTIAGIVVKAYVKASFHDPNGSAVNDSGGVYLLKAGTIVGANRSNTNSWETSLAPQIYGGPNDLWGTTWTPADINNANFGISISAAGNTTTGAVTASVDYISITVYYIPSASGSAPLGWTQGAAFAGGGSALQGGLPTYWGDTYAITGDGATAKRGEINQSANQDYLGVQIIQRNTAYRVRVRLARNSLLATGTLHINLQSTSGAFTTTGLAVSAAQLGTSYAQFVSFLTDTPLGAVPSDLLIQVYADGTPTNNGVFLVDDIEIFPANQPYLAVQARASTVNNPETFDGVNGLLEPTTNQPVRTAFVITDRSELLANDHLYLVCDNGIWRTQDNGGNPSNWSFSRVSDTVGTPSINGVDVGEDWAVIAHPSGLYLYYFGSEPTKISQEVQTLPPNSPAPFAWDQINWQSGSAVWVKVDIQNKRVMVGAPVGANQSVPNKIVMMNYRGLESSTAIIGTPPMRPSYTGRFIAQAVGRKWSSWTISANCCWVEPKDTPLAVPGAGAGAVFFGNSAGNGKIYNYTSANGYLDDGQNIPSYYDTSFVPSPEQKEQFGMLGSLCLLSYLRAHIQGSGNVTFTSFGPDYVNSQAVPAAATPGIPNQVPKTPAAPAIALSSPAKNDIETFFNFTGERMNVRIQVTGAAGSGPWFSAQKLELFVQPSPTSAIRGFN